MEVRGKTVRFVLAGVLLVGALVAVSRRTRPPPLPGDADHRGVTTNAACGSCHGEEAGRPLAAGHPPKEDCRYCHRSPV